MTDTTEPTTGKTDAAGSPVSPTPASAAPASTTPSPAPAKKGWVRLVTPVLAILAALAIGFLGGLLVGQNGASQAGPGGMRGGQQGEMPLGDLPQGMQGGAGGDLTSGTVTSIDGDTITLDLADGSTITVSTGADTTVTIAEEGSVDDLTAGDSISVVGEAGDDGTVSATHITSGDTGFGAFPGATPGGNTSRQ